MKKKNRKNKQTNKNIN